MDDDDERTTAGAGRNIRLNHHSAFCLKNGREQIGFSLSAMKTIAYVDDRLAAKVCEFFGCKSRCFDSLTPKGH